MLVLGVNEMPLSVGRWLDSVILNCLGPTSITSASSELRGRKLLAIQDFTSCRQVSSWVDVQFHQVSWIGIGGCQQHSNVT